MALGEPMSLAEELEVDAGKVELNLQKAWHSCAKLKCFITKVPESHPNSTDDLTAGVVKILHLPARPAPLASTMKPGDTVTHLLDLILGVEGPIDFDMIKGLMLQGDIAALPEPFKPKGIIAAAFKMNLAIIPSDGKYIVVKYFMFEKGSCFVGRQELKRRCYTNPRNLTSRTYVILWSFHVQQNTNNIVLW